MERLQTQCCIVGGGPAGMMAGLLLARAGVDVIVLEKHADFFRDFRGDTIHPSTLQMLDEIGLLDKFLQVPHDELQQLSGQVGSDIVHLADFSHLPTRCKFIAFMPQWDFLNFLRDEALRYPTFRLLMQTECTDLVSDGGRVTGITARGPSGDTTISCALVLGTDGRASTVRARSGLQVKTLGAPMDVLWMRIPKAEGDTIETLGIAGAGNFLILIDRHSYWQTAFVFAKGTYQTLRQQPIERLRERMERLAPFLKGRLDVLSSWDVPSLLEVRVDRLERWYAPGVLCIGDAAHAMSPIGGVGVNLALQDAVACANALSEPLAANRVSEDDLARVQQRRTFPVVATQTVQLFIQNVAIKGILRATELRHAPAPLRLASKLPAVRRTVGRLIGLGFRPERIRSPLRAQQRDESSVISNPQP